MKKVEAIPVCPDCNCVMFKKTIHYHSEAVEGWTCPECNITRWDDTK